MTERAAPLYCPYCGDERLRPWGDHPDQGPDKGPGQWHCEDCLRVFTLRYAGTTGAAD